MPPEFQYQPLPEDRMIRLLEFLPGDLPSVQVITTKLDTAPKYAALSYTWGENNFDHNLSIDNSILPITKNLSEAFDALFRTLRYERLLFWIDAVCINQKDLFERGSQVSFMDEIYRSAQKVFVWLGGASSESNKAMDKMAEWSREISNRGVGTAGFDGHQQAMFSGPPGTESHEAWLAIKSLWGRPWWRRAWIVQETVPLPEERISIHCGNRTISMTNLQHILDLRYQLVVHNVENDYLMTSFEQGFAEVLDNTNANLSFNPRPLTWVLDRLRTFECKDPRDKVYAALSMACDFPRGRIQPDYTRLVADVYTEVAQQLSCKYDDHSLDFLGYFVRPVEGLSRLTLPDDSIPTWVPDWRGPKMDITPLRKHIDIHHEERSPRAYNASLDARPKMKILGRKLHISGVPIDTIVSSLPVLHNSRISNTSAERQIPHQNPAATYVSGGTIFEACSHAVMADVDVEDPLEYSSSIRRGAFADWDLVDASTAELSSLERSKRTYLLNNLKCATLGRRIYTTAQGYIGLGPGALRPGDQICLFLGGQVLYVLRHEGGETQFVGETYVHGVMDGEVLSRGSTHDIQEFVLV